MSGKTHNGGIRRRSVLRTAAVGGVVVTGVGMTGAVASQSQKRGGRAQFDGEIRRKEPFTLMLEGTDMRPASCMSGNSADQTYLTYSVEYCDSDGDDDEDDGSLYVIPDEAELVSDQTYVFHSSRPCRRNDLQKVAFGPSQTSC